MRTCWIIMSCLISILAFSPNLAAAKTDETAKDAPSIAISRDMGDAMAQQANRVKEQLQRQAKSLFERQPLGWNWETIDYLYKRILSLPLQVPTLMGHIVEQGKLLGAVGSLLVLTFLVALGYSLFGQKRIMKRIEGWVAPYREKIPAVLYPFILSALRIVVAALFPLLLLSAFALINAMIRYQAAWFQLTGRLLGLWAIGGLIVGLLRESLTRDLFSVAALYGRSIFQLARLALLYAVIGIGLIWAAQAFKLRPDVLALLKFALSITIILVLFLLLLKKKAMLSLVPQLPYASYQRFTKALQRYYLPFILFSVLMAFLWSVGYRQLGLVVLVKTWSTVAAYLGIMLAYHVLRRWLYQWHAQTSATDETAQFLFRSFKALLVYATVTATVMAVLNLLGLLVPLQQVMSVAVFKIGDKAVTFWIMIEAAVFLLAFVYASRLLQAYLDYKVYPAVGIDPGLGYALNTLLKYCSYAVGLLISLKVVGMDLRLLLVFAGAVGIGIGLGLQNMAANVISGFSLIFGGKVRKGDWVEVAGTLGTVTDIYLQATRVRNRDNVEYLIPNSQFMSSTIINYSLSSPMIRMELPVGVSYAADPRQVEQIILKVAQNEAEVSDYEAPTVRFVGYGDSAINFELLFWIDVRQTPRRRVRSNLYFAIFDELKKAGIEIPFPQRDIHIRSNISFPDSQQA